MPIQQSDSQANFDAGSAVYAIACAQVHCDNLLDHDWRKGDNDGNMGWSNPCRGELIVPTHVPDGIYSIQWALFGWGNGDRVNSPWQSCVDMHISGGPLSARPACPLWHGGDNSNLSATACVAYTCVEPTYQGTCRDANACQGRAVAGLPLGLAACLDSGVLRSSWSLGTTEALAGAPDTLEMPPLLLSAPVIDVNGSAPVPTISSRVRPTCRASHSSFWRLKQS